MKIQHYLTFDRGGGPVSLVEFHLEDGVHMIRITHNARFDRVKEVDPIATREAVDNVDSLGEATTKVTPEHSAKITQETLAWASRHGCSSQGLRWGLDGSAILFRTEADAAAWSESSAQSGEGPQATGRRWIMG